jgi:hypothetical protein
MQKIKTKLQVEDGIARTRAGENQITLSQGLFRCPSKARVIDVYRFGFQLESCVT